MCVCAHKHSLGATEVALDAGSSMGRLCATVKKEALSWKRTKEIGARAHAQRPYAKQCTIFVCARARI